MADDLITIERRPNVLVLDFAHVEVHLERPAVRALIAELQAHEAQMEDPEPERVYNVPSVFLARPVKQPL